MILNISPEYDPSFDLNKDATIPNYYKEVHKNNLERLKLITRYFIPLRDFQMYISGKFNKKNNSNTELFGNTFYQ